MQKKNLLITGPPGIGKTTLIRKISDDLRDLNPVGFYTEEIRVAGTRKGFSLVSLDGMRGTLSHTDITGRYRVGRYGVDVSAFEAFLGRIAFFNPDYGLIVIDEIGKMECISAAFRKVLMTILDSEKPVIATIASKGEGIIEEIKRRDDVQIFVMTQNNRNSMSSEISSLVRSL